MFVKTDATVAEQMDELVRRAVEVGGRLDV